LAIVNNAANKHGCADAFVITWVTFLQLSSSPDVLHNEASGSF
jgi:hypothetical protein